MTDSKTTKPTIAVAFSGGVDSAVCVSLLQEQGYAVEAWHMLTCSAEPSPETVRLADALQIPLHCVDLRERFEREVVAPFYQAYADGLTPNPCAWCNPRLKFGALRQLIPGPFATGHYVGKGIEPMSGVLTLRRGADAAKDQSYFLYALTRDDVHNVIFPLADMTRAEVVALAKARNLPIPEARLSSGSQDICFIPDGDYRPELLKRHPGVDLPGDIIDCAGRVLGRHTGLANYTRGQRRGIGVATGGRAFVVGFDREKNTLTLGPREALEQRYFMVGKRHWLVPPLFPMRCEAVTRYHHKPFKCTVCESMLVEADEPQTLITPGQACVFYRDGWLLGGGEIVNPEFTC